jgi:hypothetical protein
LKHINRFRLLAAVAVILGGMLFAAWVLRYAQTLARVEATIDGKHYVFLIEDRGRFSIAGSDLRAVVRAQSGGELLADIIDGRMPTEKAHIVIDEAARTVSFITDSDTVSQSFGILP